MPTGYGTSAICQVAALQLHGKHSQQKAGGNPSQPGSARRGPAVVVSPLIALQEDQLDRLLETLGGQAAVAINSGHSDSEVDESWAAAEHGDAVFIFLAPEQLAKAETVERLAALDVVGLTATASPPVRDEIQQRLRMKDPLVRHEA
ncbi:superfamily II DNA helicase RecQ [Arthrobacter sp. UYCu723]